MLAKNLLFVFTKLVTTVGVAGDKLSGQTHLRALELHQVNSTFASANDTARIQHNIFIRGAVSANHGDSPYAIWFLTRVSGCQNKVPCGERGECRNSGQSP